MITNFSYVPLFVTLSTMSFNKETILVKRSYFKFSPQSLQTLTCACNCSLCYVLKLRCYPPCVGHVTCYDEKKKQICCTRLYRVTSMTAPHGKDKALDLLCWHQQPSAPFRPCHTVSTLHVLRTAHPTPYLYILPPLIYTHDVIFLSSSCFEFLLLVCCLRRS